MKGEGVEKWDGRGTDLNPQKRGINWMCRVREGESLGGFQCGRAIDQERRQGENTF